MGFNYLFPFSFFVYVFLTYLYTPKKIRTMKTKNLFRVLPAVAAMLLFAACSGDDQNDAPVTEPETPVS